MKQSLLADPLDALVYICYTFICQSRKAPAKSHFLFWNIRENEKEFKKSGDKKHLEQLRELRERYVNFNENFRDFIRYAKALHRKGKIDFIVLNGDIVDFVHENFELIHKRPRSKPEPHYPPPKEPFEKYIPRALKLCKEFSLDNYTQQRMALIEEYVVSLANNPKIKQQKLSDFF